MDIESMVIRGELVAREISRCEGELADIEREHSALESRRSSVVSTKVVLEKLLDDAAKEASAAEFISSSSA